MAYLNKSAFENACISTSLLKTPCLYSQLSNCNFKKSMCIDGMLNLIMPDKLEYINKKNKTVLKS